MAKLETCPQCKRTLNGCGCLRNGNRVDPYAFCESTFATPLGKWHIRKVTEAGLKLGGGIDTPSLCGHVKEGWDLSVPLTEHHLEHACPRCVEAYRKLEAKMKPIILIDIGQVIWAEGPGLDFRMFLKSDMPVDVELQTNIRKISQVLLLRVNEAVISNGFKFKSSKIDEWAPMWNSQFWTEPTLESQAFAEVRAFIDKSSGNKKALRMLATQLDRIAKNFKIDSVDIQVNVEKI